MNINVNGEPQTINHPSFTVAELLVLNKVEYPESVSVQLNGKFVDSKLFGATALHEKDEVEFLYFLGGGEILHS